jgi:succinate dehydrogenase / fumarate reductase cytochrome b subunit
LGITQYDCFGLLFLAFLLLHFYDFWVPEMVYKYVEVNPLMRLVICRVSPYKFVRSSSYRILLCVIFIVIIALMAMVSTLSFNQLSNNKYSQHTLDMLAIVVPFGFISLHYFIILIINIKL